MPHLTEHRRLPSTEVYACSKKEIKAALNGLEEVYVHFGKTTHFTPPRGLHPVPENCDNVVLSVTIDRENQVEMDLYPIRNQDFNDREHELLIEKELIKTRKWIETRLQEPELQVVSNRVLLLELCVDGFTLLETEFS